MNEDTDLQPSENSPISDGSSEKSKISSENLAHFEKVKIEKLEREIYGMEDRELPHHLMHKRKWSEYLLDFFMLFLAIFLGFLAENYRGNISDRNKETNYMIALMADLHQDITAADNCIAGNKRLIAGYESTLNDLSGNLKDQETAESALMNFYKYCINNNYINISDGTIAQLKNNGGFRLLRKKYVIKNINVYYNKLIVIRNQEKVIDHFFEVNTVQAGQIFNYATNKRFIDSMNLTSTNIHKLPELELKGWLSHKEPTMLLYDNKDLSSFMFNLSIQEGLMVNYMRQIKGLRTEAINLRKLIKKEYHLKEE